MFAEMNPGEQKPHAAATRGQKEASLQRGTETRASDPERGLPQTLVALYFAAPFISENFPRLQTGRPSTKPGLQMNFIRLTHLKF